MVDVVMPQLGESVAEGTVTKWLVREGDRVTRQQPLAVVSTDKADSEVTSTASGRVVKLLAAEGQTLATGKPLCTIDETAVAPEPAKVTSAALLNDGAAGRASAPSAPNPAPAAPAVSFQKPAPAAAPAPAPAASAPAPAPPSAPAAHAPAAAPSPSSDGGRTTAATPPSPATAESRPLASPSTRKAALEAGVDLRAVEPTGERGRITQDDVRRAAGDGDAASLAKPDAPSPSALARIEPPAPAPAPTPETAELAALLQTGGYVPPIPGVGYGAYRVPPYIPRPGDKVVPFTRRRRITADHMVYSKMTAPHVVTVAEVDLHATSKLRDEHKDRLKKEGVSLTFLSFVCSAVIRGLRENPEMNSRVLSGSYVVLKDIHLGVAVDTPGGLIVPNIKQADQLSLRGIAAAIDAVAARARAGKVTADDLMGTTFTVSNPGLKGNLFGGAIISQPNAGILRMGEIRKRPVVITRDGEDAIAIHPVMFVALSYDHRIIDGVLANSFLWRVADILSRGEFEI